MRKRTSKSLDSRRRLVFSLLLAFFPPSQNPKRVGVSDIREENASAAVSFCSASRAFDSAAALTSTGEEEEDEEDEEDADKEEEEEEEEAYLRLATMSSNRVDSVWN